MRFTLSAVQKSILTAAGLLAFAGPAWAAPYPVSGRWGASDWTEKGAIDCTDLRVINFFGEQRSDTGGGVPGYRNNWVRRNGEGRYRVADWFTTGQVRNGQMFYELRVVDGDRIEMIQQRGGTLRLQRCR